MWALSYTINKSSGVCKMMCCVVQSGPVDLLWVRSQQEILLMLNVVIFRYLINTVYTIVTHVEDNGSSLRGLSHM